MSCAPSSPWPKPVRRDKPAALADGFMTYLPHARRRMEERGISEEEVETVLEAPALEYLGNLGRTVAERILPGRRLAVKVVCNLSAGTRESWSPWSWVGP